LENIVKELTAKGIYAFRTLTVVMKKIDKVNSGRLKRSDFTWGVKEAGLYLSKHDLDKLFKYFDKKCEDSVNYVEFVNLVNGSSG